MRFRFDHQLLTNFANRFYPFFIRIKRFIRSVSVLILGFRDERSGGGDCVGNGTTEYTEYTEERWDDRSVGYGRDAPVDYSSKHLLRHGHNNSLFLFAGEEGSPHPTRERRRWAHYGCAHFFCGDEWRSVFRLNAAELNSTTYPSSKAHSLKQAQS